MPDPTPKKRTTFDPSSYARSFAPMALEEVAGLAKRATNEGVRLAACNTILDRAYGKAAQTTEQNIDLQITIRKLFDADIPKTIEGSAVDVTPLPTDKPK